MDSLAAPTIHDRDYHIAKPVYAERSVRRALKEGRLTQDDVDLFCEFITELQASQGIGDIRKNKLVYFFVSWRRFLPPYRENGYSHIPEKNASKIRAPGVDTRTRSAGQILSARRPGKRTGGPPPSGLRDTW